jgi:hypothetical protein
VDLTSVLTVLSIAAFERRHLAAIDIKGAYLNAHRSSVTVFMRIQPQLVGILKELYQELLKTDITEYICPDGSMIVQVLKALYGLIESALLWYQHLSSTLKSAGFTVSANDRGVFYKNLAAPRQQCVVCVHVDDLLVASTNKKLLHDLLAKLTEVYSDLNVQQDTDQLFYLGMQLDLRYSDGAIHVSQPGFINDVLAAHPVTRTSVTPTTEHLFRCDTDGNPVDVTEYASRLMKLNFLMKRSRPDLT